MNSDNAFLAGKTDMDPNMPDRPQQQQQQQQPQHTVVLDDGAHASTSYSRVSPPKAVIDSSPLQSAMDKNKESLKVKLLVRRSFDQLVQQGIMPPLKTSPAIYEQRRQLERAKTGDLLKAKIKKRPDRVELEQRHILEHCDSNIDPSLAEKRRMLEKALLVDHLNSKISHRPGPLDLIGKNILHVEEPIERIVKEGRLVDYALTLDESSVSVSTPSTTVGEGEDSLSSEGESLHSVVLVSGGGGGAGCGTLLQPQIQLQTLQTQQQQQPQAVLTTQPEFFALKPTIPIVTNDGTVLAAIATPVVAATTAATVTAIATVADVPMDQGTGHTPSITSTTTNTNTTSNLRPILPTPSANTSGDLLAARPTLTMTTIPSEIKLISAGSVPSSGGGKDKSSKKKSKSKSITKAKPMKFHEYKGPPSAYKSSMSSSSSSSTPGHGASSDSNYQLIMQQQTLLSYLEDMCKQPAPAGGSMPSPSNREQQQGATDGEDIAGSDLTPLDSPLSNAGVSGGGGGGGSSSVSSTSRGGGTAPPITTTPLAVADLALDTLNKLKVSQLKKYCKQYNLAVSGTKSNLIERLKPFLKAIDPNAAGSPLNSSGPLSVSSATAAAGATVDQELEDSLLAEQQKRIAELQLQLKKSQEELEQFRSLCNNQFGAATGPTILPSEPTMVGGQMSPAPPPPPPLPTAQQLSAVLVGSQFSTTMPVGEPTETRGVDAPNIEPPDTTTMPVLEDSFFLEGLSAADSTTVDYGHDMEEILPPELTGGGATGTLPVPDRSPTHMATLDKVLGQVQPTISSIAMNAGDPNVGGERNNSVGSAVSSGSIRHGAAGGGLPALIGGGGGPGGGRAVVGDMHDLSLSLKSVNFDTVTGTGDDSMQQDTIMLNDFGDIDLVDFHMHSLDSDGPFPMLTNHDPDPSSSTNTNTTTDHYVQTHPTTTTTAAASSTPVGLFGVRDDLNGGGELFANHQHQQQQHDQPMPISDPRLHHHQTYVNNNNIINGVGGENSLRLDLLNHGVRQAGITVKQNPLESHQQQQQQHQTHHHHHLHHHHQQQPQQAVQQSDTNNNSNYDASRSIGTFRFAMQVQQPVASSSTSSSSTSTSSSPANCFKTGATTSTNANLSKPTLHSNHHQHQHHQQQHFNLQHHQQQQHQHHQQQHHQQQQQQHHPMSQLTAPSSIVSSSSSSSTNNGTLIGDQIDSFQDNAMDFESLLTTDPDTDSVLSANNCHRMVLDCAQDKPMFSYLPDNSLLDYFNEDCNGHDYEIKHLEY